MPEDQDRLTVSVGDWEQSYFLRKTNAPADYDLGGTIALHENADGRYILIPEQSLECQQQRYASGLHSCEQCPAVRTSDIVRLLVDRLLGDID